MMRKKAVGGWRKGVLIILCSALAFILLIGIFAMVYVNYLLNRMNKVDMENESTLSSSQAEQMLMTDPELESIGSDSGETYVDISDILLPTEMPAFTEPVDTEAAAGSTEETEAEPMPTTPSVFGEHLVNILLVGQDRREGQGRQRSDSMILISFNKSQNTITITSFMRDQYVTIPGYSPNKLNAAYAFGGMSLLAKTLEVNFGVELDGIVEVDFSGFENVVDMLGGVDISIKQAEADYFNTFTDWNWFEGVNHLDGEQALAYARLREIDSDYKRANRQRNVIQALINAYKSKPLDEMLGLLDDILPIVSTNMTNSQIIVYATELFPMLASAQIESLRIPADGTFTGGMVQVRPGLAAWFQYNIDFAANKALLWEVFAPEE